MKRMKDRLGLVQIMVAIVVVMLLAFASVGNALEISHTFSRTKVPQSGFVYLKDVDFTTTQTLSINLPDNLNYLIDSVYFRSKTVTSFTSGATVVAYEVTSASVTNQTVLPSFSFPSTDAAGDVHDLSPLTENSSRSGYVELPLVAAATTSGIFTTVTNLTNGATIAAGSLTDPGTPRNVVLTFIDAAGDNLTGSVAVNGTDWTGRTVAESTTVVTGTVSYTGSQVFRTLTSVVYDLSSAGATNDTFAAGYGSKLGVPFNPDTEAGFDVETVQVWNAAPTVALSFNTLSLTNLAEHGGTTAAVVTNGSATATAASITAEAAAAEDTTYGSFTATTAPNAARTYGVTYTTTGTARPDVWSGVNNLQIVITGGSAAADTKDAVIRMFAF